MSDFDNTWANADPDAVGGESGKPPAPGNYVITLTGARAGMSKKDNAYAAITVRDLQSDHEWDILFGFSSQGAANFAKNQIRELGVDVDEVVGLDGLDTALKDKIGTYYEVEVVQASNPKYDDSTYIRGEAQAAPVPAGDIPADAGDPPPASDDDDADIPF